MNTVQIAERLRELPISILGSEDIVAILKQVNDAVADELHITASSTGNDIYKLFKESAAEIQTELLKDIFTSRRETHILGVILEENGKRNRKDTNTGIKWSSIQGSVWLIAAGFVVAILWSFVTSHGLKPPVPDAVVGNFVTELIKTGTELLLQKVGEGQPASN